MPVVPGLALLALLWPVIALATMPVTRAWPINSADSCAQFTVRRFWIAHVTGTFPSLSGTVHTIAEPGTAQRVRVDATLPVARLKMDDAGIRHVALGPDFFDAAKYPTIRFDAGPFPMRDLAAGGTLHGWLTLHGERAPVTLTLEPSACPQQPLACAIRARGTILRSEFGMSRLPGILSNGVRLGLSIVLGSGPGAAPRRRSPVASTAR